jgi:RloB-like protein
MARKLSELKRRKPFIAERQRFILICEGEKTEIAYFNALKAQYRGAQISIEYDAPAGVPITIMDKVKARMGELRQEQRSNPSAKADTVWAVFDRDKHLNVTDAIAGCKGAGAHVAYSNPCFEVWLILHHEDYHAADDHHQVQKRYQKLDPTYDPNGSKTPDCAFLMNHVEKAEQFGENQCKRREEEDTPFGRPSTTVYKLTRAIRAAAEASRPKRS